MPPACVPAVSISPDPGLRAQRHPCTGLCGEQREGRYPSRAWAASRWHECPHVAVALLRQT